MPQIAVINESTAISDADVQKMIPAFDQQWNKDLRPVWGVDAATSTLFQKDRCRRLAAGGAYFWIIVIRRMRSPIMI